MVAGAEKNIRGAATALVTGDPKIAMPSYSNLIEDTVNMADNHAPERAMPIS